MKTRLSRTAVLRSSKRRTVAGARRHASYAQAIERLARERAARTLGPDIEAVMREVHLAGSYDELRERLAKAFKNMKPRRLAYVIERANILAQLAGRFSAVEDL